MRGCLYRGSAEEHTPLRSFGNVDNMVLLNGADGMADLFAKALTMGGTGLGLARQMLASMDRNGPAPQDASALNGQVQKVPVDDK